MTTREKARQIAGNPRFEAFILVVILFNSLLIGLKTYLDWPGLVALDKVCVWIFVAEIAIRFHGRRSAREYFGSGWNWFDIVVVGASFVPFTNGISTVLRIIRVLRLLRMIRFIPELALITGVLVKSLKSMAYIGLLMAIIAFIFAVAGHELFGAHMAEYATLHETFFTLFRSLTAEDWTDLRYDGLAFRNYWVVTLYHVLWIIVGTFVMINLVVGAILNNYNAVQAAEEKRKHTTGDECDEARLREIAHEMAEILERRRLRAEA